MLTTRLAQELAAADTFIGEGAALDESLKRQASKLKGARVDRRLPNGAIDEAGTRDVLTAYAKMHGLGSVTLKVGKSQGDTSVPPSHDGEEAYPYEIGQLIATVPISITVHATAPERLQSFFEAMKTLQIPMMVLPTLLVGDTTATYSGSVYHRRPLTPPKRVRPVPTLEALAKELGVTIPSEKAARDPLVSMAAQLDAKRAAMVEVIEKRDKTAAQARILQFMRTQNKVIAEQKAPKSIAAPATGDASVRSKAP